MRRAADKDTGRAVERSAGRLITRLMSVEAFAATDVVRYVCGVTDPQDAVRWERPRGGRRPARSQ